MQFNVAQKAPLTWLLFRKILTRNTGHSSQSKSRLLENRAARREEVMSGLTPGGGSKGGASVGYTEKTSERRDRPTTPQSLHRRSDEDRQRQREKRERAARLQPGGEDRGGD